MGHGKSPVMIVFAYMDGYSVRWSTFVSDVF